MREADGSMRGGGGRSTHADAVMNGMAMPPRGGRAGDRTDRVDGGRTGRAERSADVAPRPASAGAQRLEGSAGPAGMTRKRNRDEMRWNAMQAGRQAAGQRPAGLTPTLTRPDQQ